MIDKKFHKPLIAVALILLLAIFCYFRLTPIFFQTVPYTYDQGRDFLKAEEITRFHNPTFIGPTTGIQGVEHGVWWFYYLALAYAAFGGAPQGFYIAMFILMLVSTAAFFMFIKKEIHPLIAILYLLVMTVSPYAILISFFPSNNMLTPVVIMLFSYACFMFFKTAKVRYLFLISLALGFVFETEVAFGMFIIPAFIVTSLFFPEFRKAYINWKKLLLFLAGFIPAFIPRILFELKNHFLQTHAFINFFIHPTQHNPQKISGEFHERLLQYINFSKSLFYDYNAILTLIFFVLAIGAIVVGYKKAPKHIQKAILFFSLLSIAIFIITLGYKNNFFWDYYLAGIQYMFLFLILLCLSLFLRNKNTARIVMVLIAIYSGLVAFNFFKDVSSKKAIPMEGLRVDTKTVDYIYSQVHEKNFCARIYTPPIVPYTYDYLFHYYGMKNHYNTPLPDFIDHKCYIIIDRDDYPDRIVEWRKKNIPPNAKLIEKKQMHYKTTVELWKI